MKYRTNILHIILAASLLLVTACGSGGGSSDSEPNKVPIVNAGADKVVNEQAQVTLDGTASDSDGTIVSYTWVQLSGEAVALSDVNVAQPIFQAPVAKQALVLSFQLTVTDNGGDSISDQVEVTINPVNEINLTIQGKVTDGAIADADVVAEVGTTTFNTKADSNGDFSLTIEADEDQQNNIVILVASGVATQSNVKLVSILGELAELSSKAGADGTLESSEEHQVNITHMTSALAAMMQIANDGELPADSPEFQSVLPEISGQEALNAAVVIKLVTDYSANNPILGLPDGIVDTFELVSDESALGDYTARVKADDLKDVYQEALNATLDDNTIYASSFSLPESYTSIQPYGFIAGDKLSFANGSGSYTFMVSPKTIEQNFVVSQDSVTTTLELEGKVISFFTEFVDVNGTFQEVTSETIHTKIEMSLISSSEDVDVVIYRLFVLTHYPNGEFADTTDEIIEMRIMAKAFVPFSEQDVIGEMMLPLRSTTLSKTQVISSSFGDFESETLINSGVFSFFADGTVASDISELGSGTWSINSGILNADFNDEKIEVKKLRKATVAVTMTDSAQNPLGFVVGEAALRTTTWTQDDIPGVYSLSWMSNDPLRRLWVKLDADQTGQQVSTFDNNGNGQLESNEFFVAPVIWRLEQGKVEVERYRALDFNYCEAANTDDCYLYNRRTIDLFAIDGNEYLSTNQHQFNFAPSQFDSIDPELTNLWTFDSIIVRYWEKSEEAPFTVPAQALQKNVEPAKSHVTRN